jgi:hypothetical protein
MRRRRRRFLPRGKTGQLSLPISLHTAKQAVPRETVQTSKTREKRERERGKRERREGTHTAVAASPQSVT